MFEKFFLTKDSLDSTLLNVWPGARLQVLLDFHKMEMQTVGSVGSAHLGISEAIDAFAMENSVKVIQGKIGLR